MNLQDRIKQLRAAKNLSQRDMAKELNVSASTIAMYETGARTPDADVLQSLADYFIVTTDYLLGRTDKNTHLNSLSPKEERDIAKDLEKILSNLESNEALAFDGEPLDDTTKELMRISLENSMRLAKQLAKKKFTPEKYK